MRIYSALCVYNIGAHMVPVVPQVPKELLQWKSGLAILLYISAAACYLRQTNINPYVYISSNLASQIFWHSFVRVSIMFNFGKGKHKNFYVYAHSLASGPCMRKLKSFS